jgi:hypothetical protein
VIAATVTYATIEELVEAVFSVRPVLRLYKKNQLPRGGPSPNSIGVMYENNNIVTSML